MNVVPCTGCAQAARNEPLSHGASHPNLSMMETLLFRTRMCSLPLLMELPVETAVAEGPGTIVSKVDGQQVHLETKEDSLVFTY